MSYRPKYERPKNRFDEKRLIRAYAGTFGYDYEKLPFNDHADYQLLSDGSLVAFVEIKRRKVEFFRYDTIILSEEKVEALLQREAPAIFLVGFNDGIGWVRLTEEHRNEVRLGGRTDRDDALDVENVCHIPIGDFTGVCYEQDGKHLYGKKPQWQTDQIRPAQG